MVNARKFFGCSMCKSPHDTFGEANECCEETKKEQSFEDEPEEVWECNKCGDLKDTQKEAEECCKDD